jgi:hypothetical protein
VPATCRRRAGSGTDLRRRHDRGRAGEWSACRVPWSVGRGSQTYRRPSRWPMSRRRTRRDKAGATHVPGLKCHPSTRFAQRRPVEDGSSPLSDPRIVVAVSNDTLIGRDVEVRTATVAFPFTCTATITGPITITGVPRRLTTCDMRPDVNRWPHLVRSAACRSDASGCQHDAFRVQLDDR